MGSRHRLPRHQGTCPAHRESCSAPYTTRFEARKNSDAFVLERNSQRAGETIVNAQLAQTVFDVALIVEIVCSVLEFLNRAVDNTRREFPVMEDDEPDVRVVRPTARKSRKSG